MPPPARPGAYAINGVLWEKTDKRLFMIATDGRRLARSGGEVLESASGDFQAIIPARAAQACLSACFSRRATRIGRIEVKILPNQALLRSGGRVLSTVLIEGTSRRTRM